MKQNNISSIFDVSVTTTIEAAPATVYDYVTDLPRSGDWSPECTGGQWIYGDPPKVGAVFRGSNHRSAHTVAWAPVVRGEWITESEVVVAQPPTRFSWAMRDRSGRIQESIWSFWIDDAPRGSVLRHEFTMGSLTEGMREILARLSPDEQNHFIEQWRDKLEADMSSAVAAIKRNIEGGRLP